MSRGSRETTLGNGCASSRDHPGPKPARTVPIHAPHQSHGTEHQVCGWVAKVFVEEEFLPSVRWQKRRMISQTRRGDSPGWSLRSITMSVVTSVPAFFKRVVGQADCTEEFGFAARLVERGILFVQRGGT